MSERPWWKEAVVYQVYPRSFDDSDGDGIGDIPGIVERVEYLEALGVDTVWLCPVYESPMVDNGYDVAEYRSIHHEYGTMADWERLRDELHGRDMRLVMDMVPNHTSDEHEWFERSRAGESPYDDYYYWRESEDGPPNNWESAFGGSAWSYDDRREAWYLHLFDEHQPDLNWTNPRVRTEIYDTMEWWLEKGVDGFRLDVLNLLSKPEGLPDGVPNEFQTGIEQFVDGPALDAYLSELHEAVFAGTDAVVVGEMPGIHAGRARELVGDPGPLSMVITFEHMQLDWGPGGTFDPVAFEPGRLIDVLANWQERLAEGWNCLYLANHDQPRVVSRFGEESFRRESATAFGTVLLTLRGTPFIYQGQELGMTNTEFPTPEAIDDIEARNFLEEALASDEYDGYEDVRPVVEARSRDNARTPMQWSDDHAAGFTDGEPWLAVDEGYERVNAASARADPDSVWAYYRDLIELRREHEALVSGAFERVESVPADVFAYLRTCERDRLLVLANLGADHRRVELDEYVATVLVGNHTDPPALGTGTVSLGPYEAVVYELE